LILTKEAFRLKEAVGSTADFRSGQSGQKKNIRVTAEIAEEKIKGAYPKSPSYHKISLWERLPAAKLNDRGWKPLPQPVQLVLSR